MTLFARIHFCTLCKRIKTVIIFFSSSSPFQSRRNPRDNTSLALLNLHLLGVFFFFAVIITVYSYIMTNVSGRFPSNICTHTLRSYHLCNVKITVMYENSFSQRLRQKKKKPSRIFLFFTIFLRIDSTEKKKNSKEKTRRRLFRMV